LSFKKLIEDLRNETQNCRCPRRSSTSSSAAGLRLTTRPSARGATRLENLADWRTPPAAFVQDETRTEERSTEDGGSIDPLTAFLTHAALEAGEHQAGEGQDALQLMTVHSAKAWSSTRCSSPG